MMTIYRRLEVPIWDERAISIATDYWRQRGFADVSINPDSEIVGTRGTLIGNLFSFDMSKLKASLRMTPQGPNHADVELTVDTYAQQITEWNRAFWRLEIIELHSLLTGNGDLSETWPLFHAASCRANKLWVCTISLLGQQLSADWAIQIAQREIHI